MPSIGTPELIIGLIVVFVLFGAKRMPDMARGIGQSLRIFKTETQQQKTESDAASTAPAATPPPATEAEAKPADPAPSSQQASPSEPGAAADPQARPTAR